MKKFLIITVAVLSAMISCKSQYEVLLASNDVDAKYKAAMDFFAKDCPAGRMGDPKECAYLALFLASDMARYITGAAIPVDGALSAGHQNMSSWKHPEILTGGKLGAESTIAALMENERARQIIEKYLPGFAQNEQAKLAYGMTFKQIGAMLKLPQPVLEGLLAELDQSL